MRSSSSGFVAQDLFAQGFRRNCDTDHVSLKLHPFERRDEARTHLADEREDFFTGRFEFFGAERVDRRGWGAAACTAVSVSGSGAASFISAEMEIPDSESGLYGTGTRRLRLCRNRRCCGLRSFRDRLNGRRRHCGCTGSGRCRRRCGIGCGFCRRRCSRSGCRDSGRRFCRRSRRPLDRSRLRSGRGSRLLCRLRTGRCGLRGGGPNQFRQRKIYGIDGVIFFLTETGDLHQSQFDEQPLVGRLPDFAVEVRRAAIWRRKEIREGRRPPASGIVPSAYRSIRAAGAKARCGPPAGRAGGG